MSISLDTTASSFTASGTSLTYAHTCNINSVLYVAVYSTTASDIDGVTYGGVAMTHILSETTNKTLSLWYLDAPVTGSNFIIVSRTGAAAMTACSASLLGADGINGSLGATAHTGVAASASISQALTTGTNNSWIFNGFFGNSSSAVFTATGTNQTTQVSQVNTDGETAKVGTTTTTTAGSYTVSYSSSPNNVMDIGLAEVKPLVVGDRYWVGGAGNWDGATTTHWSTSSGGGGGASVPNGAYNVHFDGNSGGAIVTVTAIATCAGIDFTGFTGTFAGSSALTIRGSATLGSGMTLTYTGAITFLNPFSNSTLTSNGKSYLSALTFNGAGMSWTIADNLTAVSITHSAGTIIGSTSTISLTGTGTVWSASGGSFTASTSTIKLTNASSSSKTFAGGSLTYNNLWITGSGTGTYTISGSNTFNDFKVDTPPHTVNFTALSKQTVTTFTVSGTAGNLNTFQSTSAGTYWYLASNSTIVEDYISLQDSYAMTL